MSQRSLRSDCEAGGSYDLVVYERQQRRYFRLPTRANALVGRSVDCDLRLEDNSVSRHHAVLHLAALEVEDLGSKNGTSLYRGPSGAIWQDVIEGAAGEGLRLERGVRYAIDAASVLKLGAVVIGLQPSAPIARTEPVREEEALPYEDVVLEDPAMMRVYDLATRVAPTTLPVLILGETGVGKDVLAEHLHRSSPRHRGPFVRVNCGALTEALLESELFGHQRGAFTGAADAKPGLLELGHGGTVFFDEIGELPLQTQVKLLHVLERGEVTRVGGTRSRQIDVRFVAATNRELSQQVQLGLFRKDLYFRLNAVCLKVVPLRNRPSEIEPLARYFLRRFCKLTNIPEPELTPAALEHLASYSWPGNIRELKNALERAPLLCGAGQILPRHLPTEAELTTSIHAPISDWDAVESDTVLRRRDEIDDTLAQARIAEALLACAGNQTRAARMLGVSRRTLVNRLNDYKLPRPRKRRL